MASKAEGKQQPTGTKPSLIDGEAASRAASTTEGSKATLRSEPRGRGRDAAWPSQIPALGWKDIFWRLWEEFNKDRVLLVAAGATFYLLLALFPALAAFISIYGFVADPVTVADHVAYLVVCCRRAGSISFATSCRPWPSRNRVLSEPASSSALA